MSTGIQFLHNFGIKYLMMPFTGQIIENRIFIHDLHQSRSLFGDGYYGKPLGISKPKNTDFDSPLVLDLIEGYYLNLNKKLDVFKHNGTVVTSDEILKVCKIGRAHV